MENQHSIDPSQQALTSMVIEVVDQLSAPRHWENDREIGEARLAEFGGTLMLLATQEPQTAARILMKDFDEKTIAQGVIHNLRSNGERIGPFRGRKIKKIIHLAFTK